MKNSFRNIGSRFMELFLPGRLPPEIKILDRVETPYNDILVIQNGGLRDIWFVREKEFFLQSRINMENPRSLELVYSRMMMGSLLFNPEPRRVLIIGLGGAVLSNFLNDRYPGTRIDVVEIDAEVIRLARRFFFFRPTQNYRVHEADGRVFFRSVAADEPYDLVFIDAFKSGSIPYHLKTMEYYEEIRRVLAPGGVVASNLYGKSNRLKPRDGKTFANVFGEIYCFEDYEEVATVLVAVDHDRRWNEDDLGRAAEEFVPRKEAPLDIHAVAAAYRAGMFSGGEAEIFNDNFSPSRLEEAVRKNNDNRTSPRIYPIKSTS